MNRVSLPIGITLNAFDWRDITDTLPEGAPFTLALEDGRGALQFYTGLYRSGALPNAAAGDLLWMLHDFFFSHALGPADEIRIDENELTIVAGTSHKNGLVRVWYVTDSRSFVIATYTSDAENPDELEDCERMIQSIEFE